MWVAGPRDSDYGISSHENWRLGPAVTKTALVPVSPGEVLGVIQFLVIDGEVPPLFSLHGSGYQ